MSPKSISHILTTGVGRRIFGLFLLAGIMPVIVTAILAYFEVNRGLEHQVSRHLREYAKAYGTEVVGRLERLSDKATEIIRIAEGGESAGISRHAYLLEDFESLTVKSAARPRTLLFGEHEFHFAEQSVDLEYVATGRTQFLIDTGSKALYLIRASNIGQASERLYAFRMGPDVIWRLADNSPYLTSFCAFTSAGDSVFCSDAAHTAQSAAAMPNGTSDLNSITEWSNQDGTTFVSAGWQLFLEGNFGIPAIDIIAAQPKAYAFRTGADFRRVFTPALALVVILVGGLSLLLIGESLVPLQRLTMVARQIASGHIDSRVRVRSDDEFGSLGDAFNNMARRLERQIKTMKAMSKIDRSILAGADFEELSEDLIERLIDLTGVEAAAIIAKDSNSPALAKMISWYDTEFIHERISLPQDIGHEWCQPRQVTVSEVDEGTAPYKERFVSYGLNYVVIIPVVLDNDLKGILLLGSDSSTELQGSKLQVCIDLAGRLAVALASVERDEALYRQAHFDELTGLPNRQLLKDRLEQHLVQARRDDLRGAMLYIDLDRFKEINDIYGHSVGDTVLAQAGERILSEVRETDTVARLGGDEFVIVMSKVGSDSTIRGTATRLLARLGEAFTVRGTDHFLGASMGIVLYPEDGDSVDTLLKNADSAMYRAKDAGRSRFEFFSKQLNAESRRKIELERELRAAFDANALAVYYQPQFDLANAVICGAEALLRWHHTNFGQVTPDEFIQLAEDSGLIVDIGRWVIDETCADMRRILDMGLHPGSISINVSARQLRDPDLAHYVLEALHRNAILPGHLQLEITETTVAQNRDTAVSILEELRAAGVHVAIDDFGTGYSSLSYLQQLPFDQIKIDKSFIEGIGAAGNSEKICRTIIKMAHELEKQVIAEGVETRKQAQFLIDNGCDSVQGYFYSHPLPQEDFLEFVEKQDLHTQRRKAFEIVS